MNEAIEKALREAYMRGYADGWKDGLDTGARLLNDIVKRKSETINAEKRSEEECEDENWYTELDDPKIAERSEE